MWHLVVYASLLTAWASVTWWKMPVVRLTYAYTMPALRQWGRVIAWEISTT
jgi:hypothetical protein